jgi:hypothetical protein
LICSCRHDPSEVDELSTDLPVNPEYYAGGSTTVFAAHAGAYDLFIANGSQASQAMFNNGSVQAFPERVYKVESLASSVHHLVERVEVITPQGARQAYVIATNVYHKTPQGWRMVAHHASPGTPQDAVDVGVKPTVLH